MTEERTEDLVATTSWLDAPEQQEIHVVSVAEASRSARRIVDLEAVASAAYGVAVAWELLDPQSPDFAYAVERLVCAVKVLNE